MADDPRLALLEERRENNIGSQIDNSALPAGASMWYYCWSCGSQTAVKPEGWYENPPPHHCTNCRPLVEEHIISGDKNVYDNWLRERGHAPVPR